MSSNSENIELLIKEETEKRLEEMGSEDYEFPKKITKADVIVISLMIAVSMVFIVLCMTGVIE